MPFKKPASRHPAGSHFSSAADEPDGLNLPDNLACLADQLAADADRLAEVYPATSPELWLGVSQGRDRLPSRAPAVRWRIAAAVVFVAGGLASWGWLSRPNSNEQVTVQAPAAVGGPATGSGETSAGSPAVAGDEPATSATGISAGLFQSLSSPEQEALLDLMDSESVEQSSLSI